MDHNYKNSLLLRNHFYFALLFSWGLFFHSWGFSVGRLSRHWPRSQRLARSPSTVNPCSASWPPHRAAHGPDAPPAIHCVPLRRSQAETLTPPCLGLQISWASQWWRNPRSPLYRRIWKPRTTHSPQDGDHPLGKRGPCRTLRFPPGIQTLAFSLSTASPESRWVPPARRGASCVPRQAPAGPGSELPCQAPSVPPGETYLPSLVSVSSSVEWRMGI